MEWSTHEFRKIASTYNSVLDIGCGRGGFIKSVSSSVRFGVDACEKAIYRCNCKNNGVKFICLDLNNIETEFSPKSVDCITGFDIVEHLEKNSAIKLLEKCEIIAKKIILLFVPIGIHPQNKDPWGMDNDYHQTHKSTWYVEDLENLGYEVNYYPEWHKNLSSNKSKGAAWCIKTLE